MDLLNGRNRYKLSMCHASKPYLLLHVISIYANPATTAPITSSGTPAIGMEAAVSATPVTTIASPIDMATTSFQIGLLMIIVVTGGPGSPG